MPIHDWSKASDGVFHDFHCGWIVELRNALNREILPPGYFATAERKLAEIIPDVLTFERVDLRPAKPDDAPAGRSLLTLADAPPQATHVAIAERFAYHTRQRTLVIRMAGSGDVVAIVEIVSRGNKSNRHAIESFLDKAASALERGIHLLVIDLQKPGTWDRTGIHAAIWAEVDGEDWQPPVEKPLTVASYAAGEAPQAFVYPLAVGDDLPMPPLFLTPEAYVSLPLEQTYLAAFSGLARPYRELVEAENGGNGNGEVSAD